VPLTYRVMMNEILKYTKGLITEPLDNTPNKPLWIAGNPMGLSNRQTWVYTAISLPLIPVTNRLGLVIMDKTVKALHEPDEPISPKKVAVGFAANMMLGIGIGIGAMYAVKKLV
jgi:hypothetical protein